MDFSKLTKYLDSLCGTEAAGCDLAIFKDGKPIYRHMSGYADMEKQIEISEKTIYPLFSSTKVITCTAALMLYEQGKFRLDDAVSQYLPEFCDMQVLTEKGSTKKAENPILIKHLFSMMAGFSYELNSPSLIKYFEETGGECPTSQFCEYLSREPLYFEPGTCWNYSLCHDVLGVLIEKLSGITLGEFLNQNIFSPLGMKDTHFFLPEEKIARVAERYAYSTETNRLEHFPNIVQYRFGTKYESGGAGLYSTVNDYMLFLNGFISGKLINRDTMDIMRTNCIFGDGLAAFQTGNCQGCGYGLGVRIILDPDVINSKAPKNSFGWGGATGTHLLIDPERNITLFYAKNVSSPDGLIASKIESLVYEGL